MSADNGVYILVTEGTQEGELEYRVAHTQNIEDLNWNPGTADYDGDYLEPEFALDVFGDKQVFTDEKSAWAEARRIYRDVMSGFGVVEYGIKILDHSDRLPSGSRRRMTR